MTQGAKAVPYPQRFVWAQAAARSRGVDSDGLSRGFSSSEIALALWALEQVAVQGPNREPKPQEWGQSIKTAKWEVWNQLSSLAKTEAMFRFVNLMDEEWPSWHTAVPCPPEDDGLATYPLDSRSSVDAAVELSDDRWTEIATAGSPPIGRHEHACTIVDDTLYVVGGNCRGRYLSDLWSLNLKTKEWSQLWPTAGVQTRHGAVVPPSAGMKVMPYQGGLLVFAGHLSSSDAETEHLELYFFDVDRREWRDVECSGQERPSRRGGFTLTAFGSNKDRVLLFGGEDSRRRALNDAWVLQLDSMRWTRVTLAPSNEVVPAPRSGHAAVCLPDSRHVAIFGGGSVSRCLDELWILDTEVWVWILVEQEGDPPSARAGHADVLVDGYWAIIGGGDNDGGCRDVSAVNVDDLLRPTDDGGALAVWERACILNPDSHLACEGQTVCAWTSGSSIVAFGGYDGSYRNSAMILKLRGQNQADVPERGEQESVASDPSRNGHEERGASQVESPVAGDGSNEDVTSLKAALKDEQDQKLALKQKVAELERRVEELSGLEVELERHRSMIEIMQRKIQEEESHPRAASARSIWSIISGQN